jgi:hypothetical protein
VTRIAANLGLQIPLPDFLPPVGWSPDVAVGSSGSIYVTSPAGRRLYRFTPADLYECSPDGTTLCLNGGRFKVTAEWTDFGGQTGVGRTVELSDDTGSFWFFDQDNYELVVKALDGRAVNDHFWLFYGSLTNVEFTLTVRDTLTGEVKTYMNPSGTFASTGDTEAFYAP